MLTAGAPREAPTALPPPPTGETDPRRAALRRMRLLATLLLVLMTAIFIVTTAVKLDWPWIPYVRAFAEAGMVGACADWFAIVALFRRPLGLPMISTRQPLPAQTLTRLLRALDGRVSVLIGQSGVGKSTLVNELVPDADRAVGDVNPVTGRGRHTSSSAIALPLPAAPTPSRRRGAGGPAAAGGPDSVPGGGHGWLIDTPGIRGFGLGHISVDRVVEAFGDLAEGTAACPPGDDHLSEGCALDEWAATHQAEARLDSLRRLLRSRDFTDGSSSG